MNFTQDGEGGNQVRLTTQDKLKSFQAIGVCSILLMEKRNEGTRIDEEFQHQ
jgi:hypothetical protein